MSPDSKTALAFPRGWIPPPQKKTQTALYFGLRFGSPVGVLAGAVAAGLIHVSNNLSN